MSLNRSLALVSIAVVLTMSGAANAAGTTLVLKPSIAPNAVIKSQRIKPSVVPNAVIKYQRINQRIMNEGIRVATKIGRKIASSVAREKSPGLPHEIPDIAVKKVSALYDEATPYILDDLRNAKTAGSLTEQRVADIINTALTKAIKNPVNEANWRPDFDLPTGKLKLDLSYPTRVANFTVKEINVYKVSGVVAASVMACLVLDAPAFKECVEKALSTAKIIVAKELGFKSAHAAEKPFGAKDEIAPE